MTRVVMACPAMIRRVGLPCEADITLDVGGDADNPDINILSGCEHAPALVETDAFVETVLAEASEVEHRRSLDAEAQRYNAREGHGS